MKFGNIHSLRNFFISAIVFVHEYHPGSETLWNRHFSSEATGPTPFSSDPTAPRPYSHTKNTLLRHQHSSMLPENLLWNYIIQVSATVLKRYTFQYSVGISFNICVRI